MSDPIRSAIGLALCALGAGLLIGILLSHLPGWIAFWIELAICVAVLIWIICQIAWLRGRTHAEYVDPPNRKKPK